MKSKAYLEYKPSGVEWLGDVPEHWEVKRTRFILSINPSKQEIKHLDPDTELAFLPMEAVGEDGSLRLDTTKPISEVSAGYTFFAEGDVSFAKITPCFENGKGAIMRNLGTGFGFGTTELTVMRPGKKLDAEYLYYLSISDDFRHNGEAWMYGAGGQKRVPDEFVKEFRFAFPPLPEQQTIASFLDRETGRIDSLIAKKQRLLELLAEQRTALISRAVTKGLDATVKLKSSGVEWLDGDGSTGSPRGVPEHWEVKRLKFLVKEPLQYGANEAAELNDPDLPRFVRITDVNENGNLREETFRSLPEEIAKPYLLQEGDLLFARSGATVGKTFFYQNTWGRAAYAGYLIRARLNKQIVFPNFVNHITKTIFYQQWIQSMLIQATIQNVSAEKYTSFVVPLPPLPEQQAIADYLDRETAKIDTLSAKVTTVIDRLKEYRTALISSAVTGKIDVSTELNTSVQGTV
jgi:type I restriction enzyme, S subunit